MKRLEGCEVLQMSQVSRQPSRRLRRPEAGETNTAASEAEPNRSRSTIQGGASLDVRLQKLLSMAGAASRRAAESLILEGRVEVNREVVRTLGAKADPARDVIKVDGRRLRFDARLRYIVLNKPRGYVTTRKDPQGRRTVMDLLPDVREYVYPVGRLDYESEGLLLLTSDGDLAARLTHPRHGVERVYEAIVAGAPDARALDALRRGVVIDGRPTAPAEVKAGGTVQRSRDQTTRLTLTLREGRNRQVRKMCAAVGHPVRRLTRVRMGPIRLADLPSGRWRDLTPREVAALKALGGAQARD
jgi:23S rRNA pseudouridine2605 synthase